MEYEIILPKYPVMNRAFRKEYLGGAVFLNLEVLVRVRKTIQYGKFEES